MKDNCPCKNCSGLKTGDCPYHCIPYEEWCEEELKKGNEPVHSIEVKSNWKGEHNIAIILFKGEKPKIENISKNHLVINGVYIDIEES